MDPSRPDANAIEAIGHVVGMLAVITGTAGLVISIALGVGFSLETDSLSQLAEPASNVSVLFAISLFVTGVLLAIFFATMAPQLPNMRQRQGAGLIGLAGIALAGAAVIPPAQFLHRPLFLGVFLLVTAGLILFGLGDRQAGRPSRSKIALNMAVLHVLAWSFAYVTLDGIALAQVVGFVVLFVWIIILVTQRGRQLPMVHKRVTE